MAQKMRKFSLITSWVLWLLGVFLTLDALVLRAGHWAFIPRPPNGDSASFNRLFWAGLLMFTALAACFYLVRRYLWFVSKRNLGVGFWLITFLFYLVVLLVPLAGYAPFFEGDRSLLQWASCACGVVLLVLGFPKLPPSSKSAPFEQERSSKGALVGSIICGAIAVTAPLFGINKKQTQHDTQSQQIAPQQSERQPTIVFSSPLPSSWNLLQHSRMKDEKGNACDRVILRSQDQNRILLIAVLEQRVPDSDRANYMKTWKTTLIKNLQVDYRNLQEDGFSISRVGDRDIVQLECHASTPKGTVNMLNKGWFDGEDFVSCNAFGNGVPVASDNDVADVINRVGLER